MKREEIRAATILIMALSLPPTIADLTTVDISEPILWEPTENLVAAGNNEYHIVHRYNNPCVAFERLKSVKSTFDMDNTTFSRLQELCDETYFDKWVRSLGNLERVAGERNGLIQERRRVKRELFTLIIIALVVIQSSVIVSPVALDSRVKETQSQVDQLKRNVEILSTFLSRQARQALNESVAAQTKMIEQIEFLLASVKEQGRGLQEMAATVPDVAWQASVLYYQISESAEALNSLADYAAKDLVQLLS